MKGEINLEKNRSFDYSVNIDEYKNASLIRERRIGTLKRTPAVLIVLGLLGLIAAYSLIYSNRYGYGLILFFFAAAVFLLIGGFFFYVEPGAIKNAAGRNFDVHQKLMYPSRIIFEVDSMSISTPYLEITEQYANMICCVDNPDFFLLIKDRERMYIIPKRELDADKLKSADEFFRTTFARRHYKMKNWIF